MSETKYRYKLSDNDMSIINMFNKGGELSENARKTLTILSEVFGGLHHLDNDQLEIFDYQSTFYNEYLLHWSLATWDSQQLTLLVIMAHDMAVRIEIKPSLLDQEDDYDFKLLEKQFIDIHEEYGYTKEMFMMEQKPYLRLLFHKRTREGDFSRRHPTIEDTIDGFRKNNMRFA